ncbi:hypothetical protein GLOTRDRAFT_114425 [Gloeophyllum trabeum ATCC 11539]|uniref:Nucleoside phosphatase GDA1/CD39 n=1 Tax=Gloeophyllum trabeum (strain ATCC 11539 / FP-39264 / Madison 617) TaxID=670483 RepID=S7QEE4_GLOTA|nr:uncharacterized protein GLOTRDRAFT_114425 [Gloeophyllum trabeum ATCC 11539]EPQ57787.1 hypothetical protein GLOTRDRAFT_114425 [Gloeophyllum trabeum ATCC 11539]
MPPPTASDTWLAGRRFGVVIDAGSSGSRLQIYSWRDPRLVKAEDHKAYNALPKIEKGTRNGDEWVTKVEPGISTFAENPEGLPAYLAPLLDHARSHIPPSLQPETPLFLLATAGMRLLSPDQQREVLQGTCQFLKFHSNFRIDDASPMGPCGSSVRIITGEEEGLFGWIAVNYLMDGFTPRDDHHTTYGFLDMGGASTQIAFEPKAEDRHGADNLIDVRLRLVNGKEIYHQVFVTTWLGYGTNQARERYVAQAITQYEDTLSAPPSEGASAAGELIPDPCLPKDLHLLESPVHTGVSTAHSRKPHTLLGTGSFEQCLKQVSPLLNKHVDCARPPCLFNGVHVPPIDFSASHFIGVSEYWYSSEHVFGLGGPYDFVQYERAASEFCARDWTQILRDHEAASSDHVEVSRLQMQCFKAAWVVNMLHEGIGMPRIIDSGGNNTTDGDKVAEQAAAKGLGKPMFQSVDTVGDVAISWTLGKMVLEASKQVPVLEANRNKPPLSDPLEDIPESSNITIKPIRPFWHLDTIEDVLAPHLPPALTKASLGFSPVGWAIYLFVISTFLLVIYRLRHQLKVSARRMVRGPFKKDRDYVADSYVMEEGQPLYGNGLGSPSSSRPQSPISGPRAWLYPLRRLLSSSSRTRSAASVMNGHRPILRQTNATPRVSPIHRSFSSPAMNAGYANGNGNGYGKPSLASMPHPPVSPSSQSFYQDEALYSLANSNNVSSLSSRSRNSSQMNLSTLVPRPASSRNASSLHLPSGAALHEE